MRKDLVETIEKIVESKRFWLDSDTIEDIIAAVDDSKPVSVKKLAEVIQKVHDYPDFDSEENFFEVAAKAVLDFLGLPAQVIPNKPTMVGDKWSLDGKNCVTSKDNSGEIVLIHIDSGAQIDWYKAKSRFHGWATEPMMNWTYA